VHAVPPIVLGCGGVPEPAIRRDLDAPTKVALDGGALANWLVATALVTPSFATVPAKIRQLAAGRPQAIAADRAAVALPGFVGYGLVYGVACSEWVPYEPA
jgi:hypothetical protein